jgi:pyruvate ferredoxin oxidoreductase delta subunit
MMTEKTKQRPKMEGRTHVPILNAEKCTVCSLCQYSCPDLAITKNEEKGKQIEIDYGICRGCSICAYICPKEAIEMVVEE